MTRGEKNNNPGNIRKSCDAFQGEIPTLDPDFKQFESALMGIRAIGVILKTYSAVHGLRCVSDLISRWAPGNENDTVAYIADVAARTGYGADDEIDLTDNEILANVIMALIHHENGELVYSMDLIAQAMALI